jgi:hypothetical protein
MTDNDSKKCTTPTEIHGFAIPTSESSDQKCTTEIQPFSFDERDQLIPKRNAKPTGRTWSRISGYQFHTSPVPASKKKTPNSMKHC